MFQYLAYGLKIESLIEFPELFQIQFSCEADVVVSVGTLNAIEGPVVVSAEKQLDESSQYYQLKVTDVAVYEVTAGKFISITILKEHQMDAVRLYCLSNAFAAVLYQRGMIPLHASAVIVDGGIAMFLGASGAGKSTLLLYLQSKGIPIFSDDVCVPSIDEASRDVLLRASYPMIKCWLSTMGLLQTGFEKKHRLQDGVDKFGVFFHKDFDSRALPPKFLFFLEKSENDDGVSMQPITGVEVFSRLVAQAYRGQHFREGVHKQILFDVFTKLSVQSAAFVIKRPEGVDSIDAVGKKVIQQIVM
jgi:energy-coupling factor transporter ATP-binding protein EcfA2